MHKVIVDIMGVGILLINYMTVRVASPQSIQVVDWHEEVKIFAFYYSLFCCV